MGQQPAESGTARKAHHRTLADEGLSLREIAERTGHPKSTVHRDLQGYVPDTQGAEARRLYELQVAERGIEPGPIVDGKRTTVPGPYVPTPEREARASQIVQLRKQAARAKYPIAS